ncbi:50S ribosomal protein L10 [Candidatus Woesearchaeota archaeon]|nr:50S ribosomal protein L10 [Candidatus Woesearchaeota archaeon]
MASEKKQQLVKELLEQVKEHPVVGLVNLENLPAQQLQRMRQMLMKSGVSIRMARKNLLSLALQQSGKEHIDQLVGRMSGLPALLFARANPFTLYKTIQKNKSKAPAKPGQKAPRDISVKAGPTNFAPGPIISELAAVGIKTKVENGKLAVIQDTVIVHEGQEISPKVAETLKRLDIQPMEIGLDLVGVWENGVIFGAKQLHIDEKEYVGNFVQAAQWAMNLAMEAAFPAAETIEMLFQKAFRDAKALALEQEIMTDLTAGELIEKGERQAHALLETMGPLPEKKTASETKDGPAEESAERPVAGKAATESLRETESIPKANPAAGQLPPTTPAQPASEELPTAAAMVQAVKERFDGGNAKRASAGKKNKKGSEQPSAALLVAEELQKAAEEQKYNPRDASVQEAEQLYEELKKKGTLR